MTDKKAPDDNNPIARRNFLLGASTAVAAGLAQPLPRRRSSQQLRRPLPRLGANRQPISR